TSYRMEVIKNSRQTNSCDKSTIRAYRNLIDFIEKNLTTKKYDVSVNSSIMKTISCKTVEPFLEAMLWNKVLCRPLSPSILDPLPTAALWGFHRYAQTSLAEFDRKFIRVTGDRLVPLIESALKTRGIDVKQLSDI